MNIDWYGLAGVASLVASVIVTFVVGWLLLVLVIASFG